MADRIIVDWRWTSARKLLDFVTLKSPPTDLSKHYLSTERLAQMILNDDEGEPLP